MRQKLFSLVVAAALGLPAFGAAADPHQAMRAGDQLAQAPSAPSGIQVDDAWVRATIGRSRITTAYMTVRNPGPQPDRLVSATSPVAGRVELHTMTMNGNVMQMRRVEAVDIAAGGTATLSPSGLHIMLLDLREALQPGAQIPLTLQFERAGAVSVTLAVRPIGQGSGPVVPQHQHH